MITALYAGSFDPITYGHLDIIKSGSKVFDKLIIGIGHNSQKRGLIPISDRIDLIKECVSDFSNVEVLSYEGLTADFAKANNINILVRGLRNTTDFEYEKEMAQFNYALNNELETVFLLSKPENSFLSSSGVKELIFHKRDVSDFVPQNVAKYLYQKTNKPNIK